MSLTPVVLLAFALMVSAASFSDELTPEKADDISELLEITGALELGQQMSAAIVQAMVQGIRRDRPETPQRVVDIAIEETNLVIAEYVARLKEEVIPLYHKYFTADEIKGMIEYHSTPLGQKAIRVTPSLMDESMRLGQEWGQALVPVIQQRIRQRLSSEGYELSGDSDS